MASPFPFTAGQVLTAAQLNSIGDYTDHSASAAFSNITIGNGTVTAYYTKINELVHYWGKFELGSTSSVGTNPALTTPSTIFAPVSNIMISEAFYEEAGVQAVAGQLTLASSTSMVFRYLVQGASATNSNLMSATTPFTWGTGDFLSWNLIYQES